MAGCLDFPPTIAISQENLFYKVSTPGCIVIATENEPTQGNLWCRDKLRRAEAMGRKPGKRLLESSQWYAEVWAMLMPMRRRKMNGEGRAGLIVYTETLSLASGAPDNLMLLWGGMSITLQHWPKELLIANCVQDDHESNWGLYVRTTTTKHLHHTVKLLSIQIIEIQVLVAAQTLGVLTCQVWRWRGSSHSLELRLRSPAVLFPLTVQCMETVLPPGIRAWVEQLWELELTQNWRKSLQRLLRVFGTWAVSDRKDWEKACYRKKNGWNSTMCWIGISRLEVAWKSLED